MNAPPGGSSRTRSPDRRRSAGHGPFKFICVAGAASTTPASVTRPASGSVPNNSCVCTQAPMPGSTAQVNRIRTRRANVAGLRKRHESLIRCSRVLRKWFDRWAVAAAGSAFVLSRPPERGKRAGPGVSSRNPVDSDRFGATRLAPNSVLNSLPTTLHGEWLQRRVRNRASAFRAHLSGPYRRSQRLRRRVQEDASQCSRLTGRDTSRSPAQVAHQVRLPAVREALRQRRNPGRSPDPRRNRSHRRCLHGNPLSSVRTSARRHFRWSGANDRVGLERMGRHLSRSPTTTDRLSDLADGRFHVPGIVER